MQQQSHELVHLALTVICRPWLASVAIVHMKTATAYGTIQRTCTKNNHRSKSYQIILLMGSLVHSFNHVSNNIWEVSSGFWGIPPSPMTSFRCLHQIPYGFEGGRQQSFVRRIHGTGLATAELHSMGQAVDGQRMLHVWYIYLHDWVICLVNVGKYSSTMERMVTANNGSEESIWHNLNERRFLLRFFWRFYTHLLRFFQTFLRGLYGMEWWNAATRIQGSWYVIQSISGWWFFYSSEKYERQLGWLATQYFWENKIDGNQTTNQIWTEVHA